MQAIFERIKKYDLCDWSVLLYGINHPYRDFHEFNLHFRSSSNVQQYAESVLEKISIDHPLLYIVADLSSNNNLIKSDLLPMLDILCNHFKETDQNRAKQIWKVAELEELLFNSDDYIDDDYYDLPFLLSDFEYYWNKSSEDYKLLIHINHLPQSNSSNFENYIQNKKEWLKNEIQYLQQTKICYYD